MRLSERLENFASGRWFPARKAKRELADEARRLEQFTYDLWNMGTQAQFDDEMCERFKSFGLCDWEEKDDK